MSVFVSRDVLMEVSQAAGRRLSDVAQLVPRHHVGLQVVRQRALWRKHSFIMSLFHISLVGFKPGLKKETFYSFSLSSS